jgi:Rv0078B-related antitoxin
MERIDDPRIIQARARATFELYEFAEKVMRQNLRHRFPEESDEAIERRLVSWLRKEPRERWDGSVPPVGLLPEPNLT